MVILEQFSSEGTCMEFAVDGKEVADGGWYLIAGCSLL